MVVEEVRSEPQREMRQMNARKRAGWPVTWQMQPFDMGLPSSSSSSYIFSNCTKGLSILRTSIVICYIPLKLSKTKDLEERKEEVVQLYSFYSMKQVKLSLLHIFISMKQVKLENSIS